MSVRSVPWLLAMVGLAIPLVGSGFVIWAPVVIWLIVLALIWISGLRLPRDRYQRVAIALGLLPVLVVLAWEGGWWLIPSDLAWLVIELADRGRTQDEPNVPDATI